MKKFMPKLLVLVMVVSILSTCLVGCTGEKDPMEKASFVNLDINPNIDLVVDENNKVVSVVANNEDAEKLLVNVDVKGKDVKVAVNLIVDKSVDDGYICKSNTDINVSATNAKGEKYDKLAKEVKTQAEKTFEEAKKTVAAIKDLTLEVKTDVAASVERKFNKAKEEFKASADKATKKAAEKLTEGKYLLMQTVEELSNGLITMEDSIKMSVAELNNYIYDLSLQVKVVSQGAIEEISAKANEILKANVEKVNEIYKKLPIKYAVANAATQGYIGVLKGITLSANTVNYVVKESKEYMKVAPKTDAGKDVLSNQVDALADELFEATATAQKDAFKAALKTKGEYTYMSVATGVEKFYDHNSTTTDEATITGAKLDKLLAKMDAFDKEYADEIEENNKKVKEAFVKAQKYFNDNFPKLVDFANGINSLFELPKLAKPQKEFKTLNDLTVYVTDTISVQIKNVQAAFNEKIAADLTPEQKQTLDACNNAIANAKTEARKYYEEVVLPSIQG